ncbi:MAG: adaptor protein MecA [Agathobacter sp.]|nr:adaptor protein MecA [Agathobacter sp.]
MEFSRIGEHSIKCVISEEEINELGFSLDDVMSNGKRTQEFMNHIFDLAEQEFQTKFEMGVKTVRADFRPDHTIALTFSEQAAGGEVLEHIKDIVNGLLGSIPKQKIPEKLEKQHEENLMIFVMFYFYDMDILVRFAHMVQMEVIPSSSLYKFEDAYFLAVDLTNASEDDVKKLSVLTDEYATDIFVGAEKRAFIEEHGDCLIKENAIETLAKI